MTGSLDEVSTRAFTAVDRRQVIRVTVDGAGVVRVVELDDRCARLIQPQQLDREIAAVWRSARQQASDAVYDAYTDAGLDADQVSTALRGFAASTTAAGDLLAGLESESFRGTSDNRRVVVELDHRGDLLSLDIATRHAATTDPTDLAADILTAFTAARSAIDERVQEIRGRLYDDRPFEEVLQSHVAVFRQRIDELVGSLPSRRPS